MHMEPVIHGVVDAEGCVANARGEGGSGGSAPARLGQPFPLAQRRREEAVHREALVARGNESQLRARCEARADEAPMWYKKCGGDPTVGDVEYVLELWMGKKNAYRKRVNPKGQRTVRSMSLGLVAQHTGETLLSSATANYPKVTEVLNMFMMDRCDADFAWTTITVNDGFASARHRDSGNEGPSLIQAVGNFAGGELMVWQEGSNRKTLGDLDVADARVLDVKCGAFFDGTMAHETKPFEGWRVSIIWFTAKVLVRAPEDLRVQLQG